MDAYKTCPECGEEVPIAGDSADDSNPECSNCGHTLSKAEWILEPDYVTPDRDE